MQGSLTRLLVKCVNFRNHFSHRVKPDESVDKCGSTRNLTFNCAVQGTSNCFKSVCGQKCDSSNGS